MLAGARFALNPLRADLRFAFLGGGMAFRYESMPSVITASQVSAGNG